MVLWRSVEGRSSGFLLAWWMGRGLEVVVAGMIVSKWTDGD